MCLFQARRLINDVRHSSNLMISDSTTKDVIDILTYGLSDRCLDGYIKIPDARISLDKVRVFPALLHYYKTYAFPRWYYIISLRISANCFSIICLKKPYSRKLPMKDNNFYTVVFQGQNVILNAQDQFT